MSSKIATVKFTERIPTSINVSLVKDCQIWPNPVKNELFIESEEFGQGDITIVLTDVNSSIVLSEQITGGAKQLRIKLSDLQSGIYFLNIYTVKKIFTKKIIVIQP